MKWIIVLLLLILGVASAVFISSFDLDFLKDEIVSHTEEATGQSVEADRLSIVFKPNLALSLEGFRVLGSGEFSDEAIIEIKEIKVFPRLGALLQRKLEISNVIMDRPSLLVVKNRNGEINLKRWVRQKGVKSASQQSGSPQMTTGEAVGFITSSFEIRQGMLRYVDQTQQPAAIWSMRDANLTVRNLSLQERIKFNLKATVLEGSKQNLMAEGLLGPLGLQRDLSGLQGKFSLDLGKIDFSRLRGMVTKVSGLPLSGYAFQGVVTGRVDGLQFEQNQLRGLNGELNLEAQQIRLDTLKSPLQDVSVKMLVSGRQLRIEQGVAHLGKGRLEFTGEGTESFNLKASLRNLEANDCLPAWQVPQHPDLFGQVNGDIDLTLRSMKRGELMRSMTGRGQIELKDGVLTQMNLAAKVLDKLSKIPLIGVYIPDVLSPAYQVYVTKRDMNINLAQGMFSIHGRNVRLEQLNVTSDHLLISGGGFVSLFGRLNLDCWLFLSPPFSYEITSRVPLLGVLADGYGRLTVPFHILGQASRPQIVTDKKYLAQKLIGSQGSELIGRFLGDSKNAISGGSSQAADVLKQIF